MSLETPRTPPYTIPAFNLLLLSNFLVNCAYSALYTTLPLYLLHNPPTPTTPETHIILTLSLIISLFSLPPLLLYLYHIFFQSTYQQKHPHPQQLPLSILLEGLGTLLISISPTSLPLVLLSRLIQGLGAAGFQISAVDLFTRCCMRGDNGVSGKEDAGVVLGALELAALVGAGVGPVFVVVLGEVFGRGVEWVYIGLGVGIVGISGGVFWVLNHGEAEEWRLGNGIDVFVENENDDERVESGVVRNGNAGNGNVENRNSEDELDGVGRKGVGYLLRFRGVWIIGMVTVMAMVSFTFLRPGLALFLSDRTYTPMHIAAVFAVRPAAYLLATAIAGFVGSEGKKNSTQPMIFVGLLLVAASYHFLAGGKVGLIAVVGITLGASLAFVPSMNDMVQVTSVNEYDHWEDVNLLCSTCFSLGELAGPLLAGVFTVALGSFQSALRGCSTLAMIVAIMFGITCFAEMVKSKIDARYQRRDRNVDAEGAHANETQALLL